MEGTACFTLGANMDGMFPVWFGKDELLCAIRFLPSLSKRMWNEESNGGSWNHAMPGGHQGVHKPVDLDSNGYADYIMPSVSGPANLARYYF